MISKDGEVHEEEIEKMSVLSRSSLDSTSTSITISSNSSNYTNISSANNVFPTGGNDVGEPAVGGVPNRFLGITPGYLWQTQVQHAPLPMVRW